MLTHQRKDI